MKQVFAFLIVLLISVMVILTACTTSSDSGSGNKGSVGVSAGSGSSNSAVNSSSKDLTSFTFMQTGEVDSINANTITVLIPSAVDQASLTAAFETTGSSVKIGAVDQVSGSTPNNFSTTQIYTVYAQNGTFKDYQVTVYALKNWKRYLSSPNIPNNKMNCTVGTIGLTVKNPFTDNTIIVLIGGTTSSILSAQVPYLITGYDATKADLYLPGTYAKFIFSYTQQIIGTDIYTVFPLDWTNLSVSTTINVVSEVFTLNTHGLSVGDTVYLAGASTSGSYMVMTVPTANTFTLSGSAGSSGDTFKYLAKVNTTAGATTF